MIRLAKTIINAFNLWTDILQRLGMYGTQPYVQRMRKNAIDKVIIRFIGDNFYLLRRSSIKDFWVRASWSEEEEFWRL